jgi:hypothetical protein
VNRAEFEHIVRAAADVVDDDVVVIGSQAILAQHPDAPRSYCAPPSSTSSRAQSSRRPTTSTARSEMDHRFTRRSATTRIASGRRPSPRRPVGKNRLIRVELPKRQRKRGTVVAWCIEKHDLVLAKLAAGREHDREFVKAAVASGLVDTEQLLLGSTSCRRATATSSAND